MTRREWLRTTALSVTAAGLVAENFTLDADASDVVANRGIPQLPDLNWEPRWDWINVKTDITPRAVGDGVADDTEAIQAACNMVRNLDDPRFSTVYLPPGIYRITRTIEPVPKTHEGVGKIADKNHWAWTRHPDRVGRSRRWHHVH